ncbi:hypothetical protein NQZ68_032688 [Dissostichus eleginoides]|nr:hypothetical protein NQZ68_032688 [Dissostichus eleginoides]
MEEEIADEDKDCGKEQTKSNLKVTSPEDGQHVSRRQVSPNGTKGDAKGSRTVPRRHTLGGARGSREILAMQPPEMDKKREAFLEHLKQKYPHHASAIMGHQERLREQVKCEIYHINLPVTFPSRSCCEAADGGGRPRGSHVNLAHLVIVFVFALGQRRREGRGMLGFVAKTIEVMVSLAPSHRELMQRDKTHCGGKSSQTGKFSSRIWGGVRVAMVTVDDVTAGGAQFTCECVLEREQKERERGRAV